MEHATVYTDQKDFSEKQIKFLKATRLPEIDLINDNPLTDYLTLKSTQEITLSYRPRFWSKENELLIIPKGKNFYLAKVKGRERNVCLEYKDRTYNYRLIISWSSFLEMKRKNQMMPVAVYGI